MFAIDEGTESLDLVVFSAWASELNYTTTARRFALAEGFKASARSKYASRKILDTEQRSLVLRVERCSLDGQFLIVVRPAEQ